MSNGSKSLNPEQLADRALEELKAEGEILFYVRTRMHEDMNIDEVDFVVFFEDGWAIPIQIKTKPPSIEDSLNDYHSHVRIVLVPKSEDDVRNVKKKFLELFEDLLGGYTGTPSKSEQFVDKALKELQEQGRILTYMRANRHKQLDTDGIDFLIFFRNGWSIPLQVKSRTSQIDDHFAKHPQVRAVLVSRSDGSVQAAKKKLLKLFKKMKNTNRTRYVIKTVR